MSQSAADQPHNHALPDQPEDATDRPAPEPDLPAPDQSEPPAGQSPPPSASEGSPPGHPVTPQPEDPAAVEEPAAAVEERATVEEPAAGVEEPATEPAPPGTDEPAAAPEPAETAGDADRGETAPDQDPVQAAREAEDTGTVPEPEHAEAPPAGKETTGAAEAADKPAGQQPKSKRKTKGKKGGEQPELRPQDVVARVGDTNERALAYVLAPDPKLSRLSRKVRDALITDLPPVTTGALLGPAALARHFVASAASGRYRDLFALWELFRQHPTECKPVLAERPQALDRARASLVTAVRLGLSGRADRVVSDVEAAQGLIWQWLRETLVEALPAVGRRPAIASALLRREPELQVPLPDPPSESWLAEAAAARGAGPLAEPVERLLSVNADRLPATVATLALAHEHYPERLPALIERVDLDSLEIGSILAWARDHGHGDRLRERARELVEASATRNRGEALARWQTWQERGVDLPLPPPLLVHSLEGLDLGRPETAVLIARLIADGADIDPQAELDALSTQNRQLAEKAYEAFVCAGLDVTLPKPLAQNPIVRDGTRCPHCLAWTWVRPGHERRCPQRPADSDLTARYPSAQPAPNGPAPSAPLGEDTAPEQAADTVERVSG